MIEYLGKKLKIDVPYTKQSAPQIQMIGYQLRGSHMDMVFLTISYTKCQKTTDNKCKVFPYYLLKI